MNELLPASTGERSTMQSFVLVIAVPLAIAVVGGAVGYAVGRNARTGSGDAFLNEVFADVRPSAFSGTIIEIGPAQKHLLVSVEGVAGVRLPKVYQKKQFAIRPDTKILARQTKDAQTFEREFERLKTADGAFIPPPLPYTEREIGVGELRIGETVTVVVAATARETVLDDAFAAVQVNVNR